MTDFWIAIAAGTVSLAVPLILAALGEAFLERSGPQFNLGIDGVLLLAALTAVLTASHLGAWTGLLAALIAGTACGGLFALGARVVDPIVVGFALLIGGDGLATYLHQSITHGGGHLSAPTLPTLTIPGLAYLPGIGALFRDVGAAVFLTAALVAGSWWVLRHTRFGLRLRAAGDDEAVALRRGIPVHRYRAGAALIAGAFAGLAGAVIALGTVGTFTPGMTTGSGFIALAVVLVGRRTPIGILAAGLLFAGFDSAALLAQTRGLGVTAEAYRLAQWVLPYVVLCIYAWRRHHRARRIPSATIHP